MTGVSLIAVGAATAALLIRQDAAVTPAAVAPDVIFEQGTDYTSISAAGFATVTPSSTGVSATVALSGVPGANYVLLEKVLKITNTDTVAANDYQVTLTRSADPDAAITDLIFTVKNGGSTLATWDAADDAASATFVIPANTALDVSIQSVITAGTTPQTFAAFTVQMTLTTNP